jgi:glycosyltransferase involved in cell wall biosynthesis
MNLQISIIIPTYNRAHFLSYAIQSVINQTYQNWELLIIDDGSTDNTKKVVEEFIKKDSRIKYFYKEHGGVGSSRNFGIKKASGDFVIFLDSDDMFLPNILEEEVKYTGKYKMIIGGAWIVSLENKRVINYVLGPTDCCLFERSLFEKYGYYDEERNFSEDFGLRIKWAIIEHLNNSLIPKKIINKPLCVVFKHKEHHLTDNLEWLISSAMAMVEKYQEGINILPSTFSDIFLRLGYYEILAGNPKEGRNYFLRSLSLKKFNLPAIFLYMSTFIGKKAYTKLFNAADWTRKNIAWKIKVIKKKREYPELYKEAIKIIQNRK